MDATIKVERLDHVHVLAEKVLDAAVGGQVVKVARVLGHLEMNWGQTG